MKMRLASLAAMMAVAACGEERAAPTFPTPAASVLLTIVSAVPLMKVGANQAISTYAVFDDGTGRPVSAEWSTSAAAVATVSANGLVTAVGNGTATITATAVGRSASYGLRVIPDYAGTWEGEAKVLECTGGDPGTCTPVPCPALGTTCPASYPAGRILRIRAILTHRDENVQGFVSTSGFGPDVPSTGAIDASGALVLSGVLEGRDSQWRVLEWKTTLDPAGGGMRGTFIQTRPSLLNTRQTPPARLTLEIVTLHRTGPAVRSG